MIYQSVFSGIESASVAWSPLGWRPLCFAENAPFPSAVLAHHYPDVPNYGDVRKFREWPDATVDVLVGGSPCQSFSIAGFRKGLVDPRGNLALVYLAIADRYKPEWIIWENVPGVLSSNEGRDFSAFIGGLAELGYGICWRVLDSQYVRVDGFERALPQRRRRLFVVGYLGNPRPAASVLFERESLRWNSAPCREAREGIAGSVANSLGCGQQGGFRSTDLDNQGAFIPSIANPLTHRMHKGVNTTMDEGQTMVAHALRADGFDASEDGTGRGTPLIAAADPISANEARTYTHEGANNFRLHNVINLGWRVRRLTVTECERLMGFPDNYTALPNAADGPRYRALGNAMAVNVMRWIGRRIEMVDGLLKEVPRCPLGAILDPIN